MRKSRKSSLMSTGLALSISDLDCVLTNKKKNLSLKRTVFSFTFKHANNMVSLCLNSVLG